MGPESTSKKAEYSNIRGMVQKELHQMKSTWLSRKADEIQLFADYEDIKQFYSALKTVHGPTTSGSFPFLSPDGQMLITDKEKVLEYWTEHLHSVLNGPSIINDETITHLPQVRINNTLDELFSQVDVEKSIKRMLCGNAPASNFIPAEVYAAGGPPLFGKLTKMYPIMWNQGKIPHNLRVLLLFISTNGNETGELVIATEVSSCCPFRKYPCQDPVEPSESTPQA